MKFTAVVATLVPAFASATLTYNITQALAPGEFQKYQCLSTAQWNTMISTCIQLCQIQANKADGCAYDDFTCHSVNYDVSTEIIEPCVFSPSPGGHGTCTLEELGAVRPLISDIGNFFNATLYAAYIGCPLKLSPAKTLGIIATEGVQVTY